MPMFEDQVVELFKSMAEQTEDCNKLPTFQFYKLLRAAIKTELSFSDNTGRPDPFQFLNPDNLECNGAVSEKKLPEVAKYAARAVVNAYLAACVEFGEPFAAKLVGAMKLKT